MKTCCSSIGLVAEKWLQDIGLVAAAQLGLVSVYSISIDDRREVILAEQTVAFCNVIHEDILNSSFDMNTCCEYHKYTLVSILVQFLYENLLQSYKICRSIQR